MKVLYASIFYDYNRRDRGYSPEYYNLYSSLQSAADSVIPYDYGTRLLEVGRTRMNEELLETVLTNSPDLAFFTMSTDELAPTVLDQIKEHTITAYYAYDDAWRKDYVDFWSSHFTYVLTTSIQGGDSLRSRGHRNAIYLPLAVNHTVYRNLHRPQNYEVSFVGQFHPYRKWLIDAIKRAGIPVAVWGAGWKGGRISQDKMVEVFNQTKVSLNLPNDISWDFRYLLSSPLALKNTLRSKKAFSAGNLRLLELASCGAFQIAYYWEGLERLMEIGTELALFLGPEQLVDRVKYYLSRPDERADMARRAHERTIRDHTLQLRFQELFGKLGLDRVPRSPGTRQE